MEIVAKENRVSILDHGAGYKTEKTMEDPMEVPRTIMAGWSPLLIDDLPHTFCGMKLFIRKCFLTLLWKLMSVYVSSFCTLACQSSTCLLVVEWGWV